MLVAGIAALGAFAGFLAGLLGIGGGIVLVPGLFFIFSALGFTSPHLMHLAVGTSLAIIVPTGFSSARTHWKKGNVDTGLLRVIGPGILLGVVSGTALASGLTGVELKMVFATAILIFAVMMVTNPSRIKLFKQVPGPLGSGLAGFVIGNISTLIGIGGATLSVPYMSMGQVPMHRAIGTASALGLFIAIPAAAGFFWIGRGAEGLPPLSFGYVNVLAWAAIIPISVSVAPLGAKTAHRFSVDTLRRIFAVFMVIVAVKMWIGILS